MQLKLSSKTPEKPSIHSYVLKEDDLYSHLEKGPIKVKDLIVLLKGPLKANASNKEIFKELVKKMAVVKLGTSDDEKWLSLKDTYIKKS